MYMMLANVLKHVTVGAGLLGSEQNVTELEWWQKIIKPIITLLNQMLLPILIILGTAGSIYVIVLGVQFSKAETSDKREEAKKRMINAIIGFVIMIVLLILLKLFTANAGSLFTWMNDYTGE